MNGAGALVVRALLHGATPEQIAQQLAATCPVTPARAGADVTALLARLVQEKLVRDAVSQTVSPPPEHEAHERSVPPATAVWSDYPVGKWAKNMRDAAKLADQIAARREAGEPVGSETGALTEEQRQLLDDIDPGWRPA
ncbi:PqqD family protein [Streptomyces sp. SGAir0957]